MGTLLNLKSRNTATKGTIINNNNYNGLEKQKKWITYKIVLINILLLQLVIPLNEEICKIHPIQSHVITTIQSPYDRKWNTQHIIHYGRSLNTKNTLPFLILMAGINFLFTFINIYTVLRVLWIQLVASPTCWVTPEAARVIYTLLTRIAVVSSKHAFIHI